MEGGGEASEANEKQREIKEKLADMDVDLYGDVEGFDIEMMTLTGAESNCLKFVHCLFAVFLLPIYLCCLCNTLEIRKMRVFTVFGKIIGTRKEAGCFCYPWVCCVESFDVSTAIETMQLKGSSVPDCNGAPLAVSSIINYNIVNGPQAHYAVRNLEAFIYNQGLEVLRRVCSKFPYRSPEDDPDSPCL